MSQRRRRISDEILDTWAAGVSYLIRVTVIQLGTLVEKYGNTIPPGFENAGEDALLEAGLLHLRAIDDFFGPRPEGRPDGRPRDVNASDWVKWQGEIWLDPAVRSLINWKIAHLTSVSGVEYQWRLANLGAAVCRQFEKFMAQVEKECPDREPAFEQNAREVVRHFQSVFDQHRS
jgi:hypothetical protein